MAEALRKSIVRVDWYADSWLGGVALLTAIERGVYDTIINLIYQTGGPLKDDDNGLAHVCRAGRADYRRAKARLIELDKIQVTDGHISQAKCVKELGRATERMDAYKNREIRKKRAKNEKKTGKKPQESVENNEENQRKPLSSITGANSQQAVSPSLQEGANKPVRQDERTEDEKATTLNADAIAPARVSGGGLSSDCRIAFREIAGEASSDPLVDLEFIDAAMTALKAIDGVTLFFTRHDLDAEGWDVFCQTAASLGYEIARDEPPSLKVMESAA